MRQQIQAEISQFRACAKSYFFISFGNNDPWPAKASPHLWMTAKLQELQLADDGYTVTVKPEIVVEVTYNEIQRSPQYSSGFALRFARITRIREDKSLAQVTSLAELRSLYERQFISKSRRNI